MPLQIRRGTDAQRQGITPALGEPIFVTDTNKLYIGDGTTVGGNLISGGGTGSVAWGDITGTLSLQTDLASALSGKADTGHTHALATTSINGFMSSSDKTKLNGIAAGAEVNVNADWNATSGDANILNKPALGTAAFEAASSFALASHSHGNVTSDGKVSSAGGAAGLVVQTGAAGIITTLSSGSTGQYLRQGSSGLEWATLSGSGTVTSVGLSLPSSLFTITGSPVTGSGTIDASFSNQEAGRFFAGPVSGSPGTPAFRAIEETDLPTIGMSKIAQSGATTNQVIKWNGSAWAPADDETATGAAGAPSDAEYLVKSSSGGLSAERVVIDSTSVVADWTTAGQVQLQRAALTGDVTASANSNATTIANNAVTTSKINNNAVTYAKLQDVSATDKILGRATAGSGDVEEITCTAAGRALLDDADATAQRTTLGLGSAATSATSDFAAASHSHGNITNDGKVGAASGYLLVTKTDGAVGTLAEGSANQFLRKDSSNTNPVWNTVTLTDSYVGQIDAPSTTTTYWIDRRAATARTITGFYAQCKSGTVNATLYSGETGTTEIGTIAVDSTGGSDTSLTNTSIAADGVIRLEMSQLDGATEVSFVIKYGVTL